MNVSMEDFPMIFYLKCILELLNFGKTILRRIINQSFRKCILKITVHYHCRTLWVNTISKSTIETQKEVYESYSSTIIVEFEHVEAHKEDLGYNIETLL